MPFTSLCVLAGGSKDVQAATDVRINEIIAEEQAEPALAVNPTDPMNLFAACWNLRAQCGGP